jgi:hypothetical protein
MLKNQDTADLPENKTRKSALPSTGPRKTLRPGRYYSLLALRTALWTAILIACFAYAVNEGAFRPETVAAAKKPSLAVQRPRQEIQMAVVPAYAPPQADSLALVKAAPRGTTSAPARQKAPIPRLASGASGRWFAKIDFRPAGSGALQEREREEAPRGPGDGEVALTKAALTKKIKVGGARPVSASLEKRYSTVDKEAERLRSEHNRKAEAEKIKRKRELRGQIELSALMLALAVVLAVAASRIIKAWRAIQKPDGTHWTLK